MKNDDDKKSKKYYEQKSFEKKSFNKGSFDKKLNKEKRIERIQKETAGPNSDEKIEKVYEEPWFFASCPRDVEYLLEEEINRYKPLNVRVEPGGVAFQGPMILAFNVLLNSRIASRVFKEIQIYSISSEKIFKPKAKTKGGIK